MSSTSPNVKLVTEGELHENNPEQWKLMYQNPNNARHLSIGGTESQVLSYAVSEKDVRYIIPSAPGLTIASASASAGSVDVTKRQSNVGANRIAGRVGGPRTNRPRTLFAPEVNTLDAAGDGAGGGSGVVTSTMHPGSYAGLSEAEDGTQPGVYGARFSAKMDTRGCHWIPRVFA
jgi:hypothetical protein